MTEAAGRGDPEDDLLARSVEALAVLLDAGISPASVWSYVAEDARHPAMQSAAARIAAGATPAEALADAARRRTVDGARRRGVDGVAERSVHGRALSGRMLRRRARGARVAASPMGSRRAATWRGMRAPGLWARAPVAGTRAEGPRAMAPWETGTRAARDVSSGAAGARAGARAARVRTSGRESTGARASPSGANALVDHGVATVAAAWNVAEHSGAPLSPALRGAATALRDRAETARDVRTALAGPRATARLMAWLPLVGVAMAYLIGVDVVGALVAGPLGWGVAVLGAALAAAGRVWTARLVRDASRTGPVAGAEHELVAIALTGGMSPARARQLVAEVRSRIGSAGAEHDDDSIQHVLHIAERAGAPAVELLSAEARQQRRLARAEGRTRAELLAVRLLLPLGLCVLPSFVLLGVVPVILAMVSSTFTGLM